MLTAAAVKIAGGGLGNDTCNILNEVRALWVSHPVFVLGLCSIVTTH